MAALTATLKVRVSPTLRRELERQAKAAGIPLGTHLRILLTDAANGRRASSAA